VVIRQVHAGNLAAVVSSPQVSLFGLFNTLLANKALPGANAADSMADLLGDSNGSASAIQTAKL
jgi:hypothetical protein